VAFLPLLTLASALMLLWPQAPGDGWVVSPAAPREVKRVYWDLFQTTEVWVRIIPEDPDGKPPLVSLVFQAFFPGRAERDLYSGLPKWPKGQPARLALRAEPLPTTLVLVLSLRLVIDGQTLDLTGPGRRYRTLPCLVASEDCAPNAVEVDLEPSTLRSLVAARSVEGEALGFPIRLVAADRLALSEFAERVGLSEDQARGK
jgi:hypothetical protein